MWQYLFVSIKKQPTLISMFLFIVDLFSVIITTTSIKTTPRREDFFKFNEICNVKTSPLSLSPWLSLRCHRCECLHFIFYRNKSYFTRNTIIIIVKEMQQFSTIRTSIPSSMQPSIHPSISSNRCTDLQFKLLDKLNAIEEDPWEFLGKT